MMSNQRKQARLADKVAALRSADRAVLLHLDRLRRMKGGKTCKASIPSIAEACDISQRQVQISADRLIKAGMLERIGYDFGNVKRRARGTIYKLLIPLAEMDGNLPVWRLERDVQFLAEQQAALELRVKQLTFARNKLLSEIASVEEQVPVLEEIKRAIRTLNLEQQRRLNKWLGGLLQDTRKGKDHQPRKASRKRGEIRDTTSGNYGSVNDTRYDAVN